MVCKFSKAYARLCQLALCRCPFLKVKWIPGQHCAIIQTDSLIVDLRRNQDQKWVGQLDYKKILPLELPVAIREFFGFSASHGVDVMVISRSIVSDLEDFILYSNQLVLVYMALLLLNKYGQK